MFRKTWKQIKILVILIVIIICLPRSIFPTRAQQSQADPDYYHKLNDEEKRLGDFRDDEKALKLKLDQLAVINKSRKKYNAPPVKLDILASRVANKMCREAAENNYVGHWNLAGEKPYHRYAFAGGYDHIAENAYGEWSSDDYEISPSVISSMMKEGHDTFMSERAPNDGHKQTIIDKGHNYVGLGCYISGKQFRYYEEFIDRYFDFGDVPLEVKTGEKTSVTLKTDGKNFPYFLTVHYEKFPKPISAKEISRKGSYSDFTNEEYGKMFAWELAKYRTGTSYKIPFTFSKEGLYYIQTFIDKKEITKPSSLTTKGKTPYTGIVIKVTR